MCALALQEKTALPLDAIDFQFWITLRLLGVEPAQVLTRSSYPGVINVLSTVAACQMVRSLRSSGCTDRIKILYFAVTVAQT